MKDRQPFVKKIDLLDSKFIYDCYTAKILRVDEVVWGIIDDIYNLSLQEICDKYKNNFSKENITSAHKTIKRFQEQEGLLTQERPVPELRFSAEERVVSKLKDQRRHIILNVTENCNFRCNYCPYTIHEDGVREHNNRYMDWDTAKYAIDDFLDHCGVTPDEPEISPTVGFYGGEPLLAFPMVKRIVNYAQKEKKRKKINFTLTTNGYLLNKEIADFLASNNFFVNISLDGPEEYHNQNRPLANGQKTWRRIVDNINYIASNYPRYCGGQQLGISSVITPFASITGLDRYFTETKDVPPHINKNLYLMTMPKMQKYKGLSENNSFPNDWDEYVKETIQDYINGKINLTDRHCQVKRAVLEQPYIIIHKRKTICKDCITGSKWFMPISTCVPGIRKYFVSVDGKYYVCERIPECEEMNVGNVQDGFDVDKITKLYKSFFNFNKQQCENCWCVRFCHVGCFATMLENNAQFTETEKKKQCELHRNSCENLLIRYCYILNKNPHAFDHFKKIRVT